jgi:hypothetical protein
VDHIYPMIDFKKKVVRIVQKLYTSCNKKTWCFMFMIHQLSYCLSIRHLLLKVIGLFHISSEMEMIYVIVKIRNNCVSSLCGRPKLQITLCNTKSSWRILVINYNYRSLPESVFRLPS